MPASIPPRRVEGKSGLPAGPAKLAGGRMAAWTRTRTRHRHHHCSKFQADLRNIAGWIRSACRHSALIALVLRACHHPYGVGGRIGIVPRFQFRLSTLLWIALELAPLVRRGRCRAVPSEKTIVLDGLI